MSDKLGDFPYQCVTSERIRFVRFLFKWAAFRIKAAINCLLEDHRRVRVKIAHFHFRAPPNNPRAIRAKSPPHIAGGWASTQSVALVGIGIGRLQSTPAY